MYLWKLRKYGEFFKYIFVVLTICTGLSEYEKILLFIMSHIVLLENSFLVRPCTWIFSVSERVPGVNKVLFGIVVKSQKLTN